MLRVQCCPVLLFPYLVLPFLFCHYLPQLFIASTFLCLFCFAMQIPMPRTWRERLAYRPRHRSQPDQVAVVFADVFLERAHRTILLSGQSRFQLECLCTLTVMPLSAQQFFRRWLARHENSRGTIWSTVEALHREYLAAHLQRHFLRIVSSRCPASVVAGSYPVEMYMQSIGQSRWQANDIDIFVDNNEHLVLVTKLYTDVVIHPLHLTVDTFVWKCYTGDDDSVDSTVASNGADVPQTQFALPSADLRSDIVAWLDDNRYTAANPVGSDRSGGDVEDDDDIVCSVAEGLRSVLEHLPPSFSVPDYSLEATVQLRPQLLREPSQRGSTAFTPACLKPVNVICANIASSSSATLTFPSVIRANFDISVCRIALLLHDDLSVHFEADEDTFADICDRKLRLLPTAFTSRSARVALQMARIAKYLERGFRW